MRDFNSTLAKMHSAFGPKFKVQGPINWKTVCRAVLMLILTTRNTKGHNQSAMLPCA